MSNKLYSENAFVILKLPSWASPEQIMEREEELILLASIDEYPRSQDEIEHATRKLIEPNERIREELFALSVVAEDEDALGTLMSRYAQCPLQIWGDEMEAKDYLNLLIEAQNEVTELNYTNIEFDCDVDRFERRQNMADELIFDC